MAGVRKNLAATLYSNGAYIGGQFLLVPVYLHFWGPERYGWWLVLYAIPACFNFLDAGISNSLGNALTITYQRKEMRQAQQMLNAVWKFQTLGIVIGIALFAVAVLFLPMRHWLALESLGAVEFAIASLVLCIYTALSLQLGVFTAIFRAAGRFDQFVRWNTHARLMEVAASILVLACGAGIVGVALALLFVRGTLITGYWISGRKVLPELTLTWSDAPWSEFRKLLTMGIAFMAFPVANGIANQGSAILLNHQLGPVAVVALSVSRQLARLYLNLVNALSIALHPELTSAYAIGDFYRLKSLYAVGLGVVAWTAVPAVLAMGLFGPFAITLWTKSAVQVGSVLLMACGVESVVTLLGTNAALPALASNRHIAVSAAFLLCTVAAFFPAALWAGDGPTAIPASFAATGLVFAGYAFVVSSAVVRTTPGDIFRRAINPSLLLRLFFRRRLRQMPI
jgi:O-antigen/teichoic acid export membrane protein